MHTLRRAACVRCWPLWRVFPRQAALDTIWQNIVEPETGFKDIEEMREAWRVEREQKAAAASS